MAVLFFAAKIVNFSKKVLSFFLDCFKVAVELKAGCLQQQRYINPHPQIIKRKNYD